MTMKWDTKVLTDKTLAYPIRIRVKLHLLYLFLCSFVFMNDWLGWIFIMPKKRLCPPGRTLCRHVEWWRSWLTSDQNFPTLTRSCTLIVVIFSIDDKEKFIYVECLSSYCDRTELTGRTFPGRCKVRKVEKFLTLIHTSSNGKPQSEAWCGFT